MTEPLLSAALLSVGAIGGWLLRELSIVMRRNEEARKTVAVTLADLLDIRHRILAREAMLDWLQKQAEKTGEDITEAAQMLDSVFPFLTVDDSLQARYEGAISLLSSLDPVLGFRLRSHAKTVGYFRFLNEISGAFRMTGIKSDPFQVTKEEVIASLDSGILVLSRRHGIRTWLRTKEQLSRTYEMPPNVRRSVNRLLKKLNP